MFKDSHNNINDIKSNITSFVEAHQHSIEDPFINLINYTDENNSTKNDDKMSLTEYIKRHAVIYQLDIKEVIAIFIGVAIKLDPINEYTHRCVHLAVINKIGEKLFKLLSPTNNHCKIIFSDLKFIDSFIEEIFHNPYLDEYFHLLTKPYSSVINPHKNLSEIYSNWCNYGINLTKYKNEIHKKLLQLSHN